MFSSNRKSLGNHVVGPEEENRKAAVVRICRKGMFCLKVLFDTDWYGDNDEFTNRYMISGHSEVLCAICNVTWPTCVWLLRLRTVVANLALQSPGSSWWPGLGRLLASAALLCMAPGFGTDYPWLSDHQNCRRLHSSASSRPTCLFQH